MWLGVCLGENSGPGEGAGRGAAEVCWVSGPLREGPRQGGHPAAVTTLPRGRPFSWDPTGSPEIYEAGREILGWEKATQEVRSCSSRRTLAPIPCHETSNCCWLVTFLQVHVYHVFLICSLVNRLSGCFLISVIVSKAALNMEVQTLPFKILISVPLAVCP